MKKQNNRFRNGNNNNCYTLNYKFDSVSIAGKISGTALDLIRRYNDLAKEAQGCGNYVEMEVYRQYAEHYRKIVTEINERRQARYESQNKSEETTEQEEISEQKGSDETSYVSETQETSEPVSSPNGYVETLPAAEPVKTFQVVEIKQESLPAEKTEEKTKKVVRRRASSTAKKTAEV